MDTDRLAGKVRLRSMSASVRCGVLFAVVILAMAMAVPVNAQPSGSPVITSVQPDFTAGVVRIEGTTLPASLRSGLVHCR